MPGNADMAEYEKDLFAKRAFYEQDSFSVVDERLFRARNHDVLEFRPGRVEDAE